MIFHNQKTLSLTFIITSVSLCHYVSKEIFLDYLFLEYLFVSFHLFWQHKQPPEVFCKKRFLKNITKFHNKALALESLFNKVASLKVCNFIKNRLHHSCFPLNITKFLRTAFCMEYLR